MLSTLRKGASWLLALTLFAGGWYAGADHTDAKWRKIIYDEYVAKTEAHFQKQLAVSEVAKDYQAKLTTLEDQSRRTIADLGNANRRLRIRIKSLNTVDRDGNRCQFDGPAEIDGRDAQRLIEVTQKGDAWIEALQNTIRILQQQQKERK